MSDATAGNTSPFGRGDRLHGPALVIGFAIGFSILSLAMAVASDGFLEADGVTHFLYARWAFDLPWLFADVWGRPVVTTLHALPAQLPGEIFGRPVALVAVRVTSLLLALGCAAVAWRVAAGQGRDELGSFGCRPWLAALFTLASPLVFLHSFSELTELPFALLSVCCLWAYQARRWVVLAALAGVLPAARPEGIGFFLMVAGGLVLHRRWAALPLVLIGPLAWATAGWLLGGRPWVADDSMFRPLFDWFPKSLAFIPGILVWLPTNWPYSGESVYDAGPLLKFVGMLPAVTGPLLLPFTLIGIYHGFRGARRFFTDHAVRVRVVLTFVPVFVLVVHSLLHWTGKMASSGDVRYLLAVAPFWGLLTAIGFAKVLHWTRTRGGELWGIALALVPWVGLQLAYPLVPLAMVGDAVAAERVAAWWRSDEAAPLRRTHPTLRVDHPVALYRLDMPPTAGGGRALIEASPPGTTFVWHEVYSEFNADDAKVLRFENIDDILDYGWQNETPSHFPDGWRVFTSRLPEPAS